VCASVAVCASGGGGEGGGGWRWTPATDAGGYKEIIS